MSHTATTPTATTADHSGPQIVVRQHQLPDAVPELASNGEVLGRVQDVGNAELGVAQVLTAYELKRRRAAVAAGTERNPAPSPQQPAAESGFGGEDEAWLRGEQR